MRARIFAAVSGIALAACGNADGGTAGTEAAQAEAREAESQPTRQRESTQTASPEERSAPEMVLDGRADAQTPLGRAAFAYDEVEMISLYDLHLGMEYAEALDIIRERGFQVTSINTDQNPGEIASNTYVYYMADDPRHEIQIANYADAEGVQRVGIIDVRRYFDAPQNEQGWIDAFVERYGPSPYDPTDAPDWHAVEPNGLYGLHGQLSECVDFITREPSYWPQIIQQMAGHDEADQCIEIFSMEPERLRPHLESLTFGRRPQGAPRPRSQAVLETSIGQNHLGIRLSARWLHRMERMEVVRQLWLEAAELREEIADQPVEADF